MVGHFESRPLIHGPQAMSDLPITSESFDSSLIRRRTARKLPGWSNAETRCAAEDHADVCRVLEESGFMPEAEFTSAAGELCGIGTVSIILSKAMSEALAKAELDYFACRYFFYEPERRADIWLQLTETVAPYPALAWRHLHLKAGLNVVRTLDEHGEPAASVPQWFIQSPQNAALSLRSHLLKCAANEDSVKMVEDCLAELQESATDDAVLIPAGVADVKSRYTWLNESRLIPNADFITEARVQVQPSRARRIPELDLKKAFLIVFVTIILLERFIQVFDGWTALHSRQDRLQPAQPMNSAPLPVMPKPIILEAPVSQNSVDQDMERGAKVIDLLHHIGTVRRIANSSTHPAIIYAAAGISRHVQEVQDLMVVHTQADSDGKRSDETIGDIALILPVSSSRFYCVGFGRLDDQQRIYGAFWKERGEVLDRAGAEKIVRSLNGKHALDDDARRALREELETLTEMKIFVLTPDEFLATFDSPVQADSDTVKSELDSIDQVPPAPAVPQD